MLMHHHFDKKQSSSLAALHLVELVSPLKCVLSARQVSLMTEGEFSFRLAWSEGLTWFFALLVPVRLKVARHSDRPISSTIIGTK